MGLTKYTSSGEEVVSEVTMPTGMLAPFALDTAPNGWQICDGSVAGSPALIAALDAAGRPYGGSAGAGLVPDLRGRAPWGKGTNTSLDALGENEGETTVANRAARHRHEWRFRAGEYFARVAHVNTRAWRFSSGALGTQASAGTASGTAPGNTNTAAGQNIQQYDNSGDTDYSSSAGKSDTNPVMGYIALNYIIKL